MNKIYLFDDDKEDQQAIYYNVTHILDERYGDLLTYVKHLCEKDIKNIVTCKKPAALLIHRTFVTSDENKKFTSKKIFDEMVDCFDEKFSHCPQVHFSWGDTNLKIQDTKITAINKSVFYANLEEFIVDYKDNNEIDLQTLAYGGFKMSEKLRPLLKKIRSDLSSKKNDATFDLSFMSIESLEQFHKLSISSMDIDSFEDYIEKENFTVKEFLNLLDKAYNSVVDYGKNIHY